MSHIEKESCNNSRLSVTLRCNISLSPGPLQGTRSHQHIGRFEITMQNAVPMQVGQGL
jgi:hypothetical protein